MCTCASITRARSRIIQMHLHKIFKCNNIHVDRHSLTHTHTYARTPCTLAPTFVRLSLAYPCLPRPSRKSIRRQPGRQLASNGSDLHPLVDEREQEREVTSRRSNAVRQPQRDRFPNQRHYAVRLSCGRRRRGSDSDHHRSPCQGGIPAEWQRIPEWSCLLPVLSSR